MAITKHTSREDNINKLQEVKGKTKLNFYKNKSNCYDNMNIKMDEDPFARNAQDNSRTYHEVLLLMKFQQTKPQVRNMINKDYELYFTVIKNRDDIEIVKDENENDYFNITDFFTPRHYIGRKNNNEILKFKKMRSHINHFN